AVLVQALELGRELLAMRGRLCAELGDARLERLAMGIGRPGDLVGQRAARAQAFLDQPSEVALDGASVGARILALGVVVGRAFGETRERGPKLDRQLGEAGQQVLL